MPDRWRLRLEQGDRADDLRHRPDGLQGAEEGAKEEGSAKAAKKKNGPE